MYQHVTLNSCTEPTLYGRDSDYNWVDQMSSCMRLNKYDFIALTEDWYSEANNQCQLQYHLAQDEFWHDESWGNVQELRSDGQLKMDDLTVKNRKIQKRLKIV